MPGGPERVQPCLAPGERSEPGGSCDPSFGIGPVQGVEQHKAERPGCHWTPAGPGLEEGPLHPGVRFAHPRLSMVRPPSGAVMACGHPGVTTGGGGSHGDRTSCGGSCVTTDGGSHGRGRRSSYLVNSSPIPMGPPRTGGPEGVQPCLAPGERSEPGGSCDPSFGIGPVQGVE